MISYAQNAEDVVLARLFGDRSDGTYVDVGAGDATDNSVTRHFYDLGWRGINIEPDPTLYERLAADRPDDVNLPVALSDEEGEGTLLVAPSSLAGASTLDGRVLEGLGSRPDFLPQPVRITTLKRTLELHELGAIDFLKIDVEGYEARVIRGADWERHLPRVVVVEATCPHQRQLTDLEWEPQLLAVGYRCALFDGLNRFYAQADDREALEVLAAPANVFDAYQPFRWLLQYRALEAEAERAIEYARDLERRTEEAERANSEWLRLRAVVDGLAQEARQLVQR